MPVPKVRTGRLAPDKEALDYYNVPAKHWTQTDWDQIDMTKLDVGLHSDPTPTGAQALDRRNAVGEGWFPGKGDGYGDDAMKDMRIHIGGRLDVDEDVGTWDKPEDARMAVRYAAYDEGMMDLANELDALEVGNASTVMSSGTARDNAVAQMNSIRETLMKHGIDTVSYPNAEEGLEAAIDARINSPENLANESAELERAQQLRMESDRLYAQGDDLRGEELDLEATDIEDGLEMQRDELRKQAEAENLSYISLDPGNVRSADANFQKDMIGKPDMMGSATVPMLAGSAGLGALGMMAQRGDFAGMGAGLLDTANRFGETLVNDVLTGSQGVSNAIYGTDDVAPQVQFAPRTEAGTALTEGLTQDLMTGLESKGAFGDSLGLPSTMDLIEGGIGLYDEYVKPHLSERAEEGLGGALLAGSVMMPGRKSVNVNTADTRLGKQTAAAQTKSMEEQATQVREALAEQGGYETIAEDVVDLKSLPVLSRADLQDGVLMPTAGDRTMLGRLKRSSGIDVDTDLQGGPGYGALMDDWESTAAIANSYQNKVGQVAEAAGTDKVFGTYSPMRLPSANFSTMPSDVAMQQLQTLLGAGARYNPKLVDDINYKVAESGGKKNPNKDFPGILAPDAEAFLAQRGSSAVAARKAMLGEMAKAPYRDAGFPLVEQIYRDVSYPELHDRDIGEAGDLILRLDPNASTRNSDWHKSYGTVIPSQGQAGRFADTLPFQQLYRDGWNSLDGVMTESKLNKKGEWTTPRPLNQLEKTNTINWNKPQTQGAKTSGYQMVDEQLLDELERMGLLAP